MSSYDEIVGATRDWLHAQPAPSSDVHRLRAALEAERVHERRVGVVVATATGAALVAFVASVLGYPLVSPVCDWLTSAGVVRIGIVPVLAMLVAATLSGKSSTWAQMLARAIWWSGLITASVGMVDEPGTVPLLMPVLALGCGACLWARADMPVPVGRDAGFDLTAHRTTTMGMVILAMADTQTLLLAALNHDEPSTTVFAVTDFACAVAMGIAVWGLCRLRTWGLAATVGLNLLIAGLGLGGLLFEESAFAYVLATTALIQLGLATPLLRALLRKAPAEPRPPRYRSLTRGIVLALLVLDVAAFVNMIDRDVVASACAED